MPREHDLIATESDDERAFRRRAVPVVSDADPMQHIYSGRIRRDLIDRPEGPADTAEPEPELDDEPARPPVAVELDPDAMVARVTVDRPAPT